MNKNELLLTDSGGHFEKCPLFGISRIFKNMLDDVAPYWFCIQNWYSNQKPKTKTKKKKQKTKTKTKTKTKKNILS